MAPEDSNRHFLRFAEKFGRRVRDGQLARRPVSAEAAAASRKRTAEARDQLDRLAAMRAAERANEAEWYRQKKQKHEAVAEQEEEAAAEEAPQEGDDDTGREGSEEKENSPAEEGALVMTQYFGTQQSLGPSQVEEAEEEAEAPTRCFREVDWGASSYRTEVLALKPRADPLYRALRLVAQEMARRPTRLVYNDDGADGAEVTVGFSRLLDVPLVRACAPSPVVKQRNDPPPGLFAGLRVLVLVGGAEDLASQVRGRGGEAWVVDKAVRQPTHVVCDALDDDDDDDDGPRSGPRCVVRAAWVADSIRADALQSVEAYAPKKRWLSRADFAMQHAGTLACQKRPDAPKEEVAKENNNNDNNNNNNNNNKSGEGKKNASVVVWLERLLEYYEGSVEHADRSFKAPALHRCIRYLKKVDVEVTLENCASLSLGMRCYGAATKAKVREILETGSLARVRFYDDDAARRTVRDLATVWGIGTATAVKLMHEGVDSVATLCVRLKEGTVRVKEGTRKALQWHEQLQERMGRDEVREIEARVQEAVNQVAKTIKYPLRDGASEEEEEEDNNPVSARAVGSYRRGAETCGDVDILISAERWRGDGSDWAAAESRPDRARFMEALLDWLHAPADSQAQGSFLTDDLARHDDKDGFFFNFKSAAKAVLGDVPGAGSVSYMGICFTSRGMHRRIDIKVYAPQHMAFALLYFTGSGHFNRSMRWYAKTQALSLSDTGLWKVQRAGRQRDKNGAWVDNKVQKLESFPAQTEEEIFKHLRGLEYREPHERSCLENAAEIEAAAMRCVEDLGDDYEEVDDGFDDRHVD